MKRDIAAVRQKVDQLADDYFRLKKETLRSINAQIEVASAKITKLVERVGRQVGKRTLVKGYRYVIGVVQPEAAPVIDYDKLLRLLPRVEHARITRSMVDPKLVELAIADGTITRKMLQQCLVKSDKVLSPRLYVGELKNENQTEDMD